MTALDYSLRRRVAALEAAQGGGDAKLPAPDFSVGNQGFFGGEIFNPKTKPDATPGWSPVFDYAWTLESNSPSFVAVDNAYMAWNPSGDATSIVIKQAGWYSVWYGFSFAAPLAELDNFAVAINAGGPLAGAVDFAIPVGGGFAETGVFLSYAAHSIASSVVLGFINSLSAPAVLSSGWLRFCPLFTLA